MYLRKNDIPNYIEDNRDDLMRSTRNGRSVYIDNVIDGDMHCTVAIFQKDGKLDWDDRDHVFTVDV